MEKNILERILELAITIQQIPSPTFEEGERARFVREHFLEQGLQAVGMDETGNVLGCLPGGDALPLVVSVVLSLISTRLATQLATQKQYPNYSVRWVISTR